MEKMGSKYSIYKRKKPLGTIGSLAYLENIKFKYLIVINCDVITRLNFNDLLIFHENHKQIATVSSIIHETKNPIWSYQTRFKIN